MKPKLILFLTVSALLFSCSDDKEDALNEPDLTKLHGTWDATELKIDDQTASDDAKNGRDALNFLTAQDCYIITLTFNADLSVVAENSVNYLQINVNQSGTGIDIPCPTDSDIESSTYTFDGTTLTYLDDNAQTVSVKPVFDGNMMTIVAAELGITNFDAEGELVFKKR
jgi:hypothetical protein